MNKNKLSIYFIFASFLTFLTVFFIIIQKSYFNLKQPQELVQKNVLLKDINPNLDLSVLSLIESKDENTDENFDFSIIVSAKDQSSVSNPFFQPEETVPLPTETPLEPLTTPNP